MTQVISFGFYTGLAALSTIATLACLANPITGMVGIVMLIGGITSATRNGN